MIERAFGDAPHWRMTQEESGLPSVDIWWAMVDALTYARDRDRREGVASRGRHHRTGAWARNGAVYRVDNPSYSQFGKWMRVTATGPYVELG